MDLDPSGLLARLDLAPHWLGLPLAPEARDALGETSGASPLPGVSRKARRKAPVVQVARSASASEAFFSSATWLRAHNNWQ